MYVFLYTWRKFSIWITICKMHTFETVEVKRRYDGATHWMICTLHSQISLKWFRFVESNCKRSHLAFFRVSQFSLISDVCVLIRRPCHCMHALPPVCVRMCSYIVWAHESSEHSFNNLKYHMAISAISFEKLGDAMQTVYGFCWRYRPIHIDTIAFGMCRRFAIYIA